MKHLICFNYMSNKMKTEYEVRVLEIDKEKMIKKLEQLGAKLKGNYDQKRYTYDLKPVEQGKWIRLRTNGKETTLTYKDVISDKIDGTKEVEFVVSDFQKANEFLEKIGFKSKAYQENKRIQYELDGVELDIDSWPLIPTYMEIEGQTEKAVLDMIEKLEVDKEKVTSLDVQSVYMDKYSKCS